MDASAEGLLARCRVVAAHCNAELQSIDSNLETVIHARTETLSATVPFSGDTLPSSRVVVEDKSLKSWMDEHVPSLHFRIDCAIIEVDIDVDSWEELGPAVTELMELATDLNDKLKDASGPTSSIIAALGDIHVVIGSAQELISAPVDEVPSPCVEEALELCAKAQTLLVGRFPGATLHILSTSKALAISSHTGEHTLETFPYTRETFPRAHDTIHVIVHWRSPTGDDHKRVEVTTGGHIKIAMGTEFECLQASLVPGDDESQCYLVMLCRGSVSNLKRVLVRSFHKHEHS